MRRWTFDLQCGFCGRPFRAQRHLVYCSTKCRQDASSRSRPTGPQQPANGAAQQPPQQQDVPAVIEFDPPQVYQSSLPPAGLGIHTSITRAFAETCLPCTHDAAANARQGLKRRMEKLPADWHPVDRALAVLAPTLLPAILRFYESSGPSLQDLFAPHQLEHLDRDLASRATRVR